MRDSVPPKAEATGSNPVGCATLPSRNLQERAPNKQALRVQTPYKRVRVTPDTFEKFIRKMPNGCWEWSGGRTRYGYGKYRRKPAHRVSFARYKGPIPPGMFVCHTCDNPPCVNPEHLWLGTCADNVRDMVEKGRACKWNGRRAGAANFNSKLTPEKIIAIRALSGHETQEAIGRRFGVAQNTISQVLTGKLWNHVR